MISNLDLMEEAEDLPSVKTRLPSVDQRRLEGRAFQLGEITSETGYKPVAFIAMDDTWTALRFKRV